jgi:hypothetical protein
MGKKTAAASGYRLSPNEVESLIQGEKKKKRIKRILQVKNLRIHSQGELKCLHFISGAQLLNF